MNPIELTKKNYIYCIDCEIFCDLHANAYDNVEDAGHKDCNWRYATDEEFLNLVKGCEESGCFNDE